jgi:hypothetical protein
MSRFVLVPYEQFNGLLQSNQANKIDLTSYSKQLADKVLNDRRMNASKRKAIYNQRLGGYLKQKHMDESKPVKVQFDNEQLGLIARTPDGPKLHTIDDDLNLTRFETPPYGYLPQESDLSFSSLQNSTLENVPSIRSVKNNKSMNSTTAAFQTPRTTKSESTKSERSTTSTQRGVIDKISETARSIGTSVRTKLLNIIRNKPNEFGVTDDGKIINTERHAPYSRSNLETSLNYWKNGRKGKAPDGARELQTRLIKDVETSDLYDQLIREGGSSNENQQPTTSGLSIKQPEKTAANNERMDLRSWDQGNNYFARN